MPEPEPQRATFRFRGRRATTAACWALAAFFFLLAATIATTAVRDREPLALIVTVVMLLAGSYLAVMASRLPGALVEPGPAGLHVRFPLAIDRTVPWTDLTSANVVRHRWWEGLGIRTNLYDHVALATVPGPAAEVTFSERQRVTVLPFLPRVGARRLRLTIERPEQLVETINARITAKPRP